MRKLFNEYYISPRAYVFLCLFCSGILQALSAPDLHSTVSNGSTVYPEQPITITCVTRNSQILAWESEDYIGGGRQIAFTSNNPPDSTGTGRNGTLAILISVTNDNGELTLTSELLISITTRSSSSQVTCRNVDSGETDSVTFHKTNESATKLILANKTSICPDDHINITCMARNTSIIQWSSNLSSRQIYCRKDDPTTRNITISNTDIDIFTEYSAADSNGNTVLTCSLILTASELSVNQQLSLSCLNSDIGVREAASISFQLSAQCTAVSTSESPTFITQTDDELMTTNNLIITSGSVILGYSVISLIALAMIAMYNVS